MTGQDVRSQTFRPRDDLAILYAAVNIETGALQMAWLVPSIVLAQAVRPNSLGRLPFTASLKPESRDRWSPYRLTPAELPGRILSELERLERSGV